MNQLIESKKEYLKELKDIKELLTITIDNEMLYEVLSEIRELDIETYMEIN